MARLSSEDATNLLNVTYPALDGLLAYTQVDARTLHTVIWRIDCFETVARLLSVDAINLTHATYLCLITK